jgi:membrane protein implicated in regulation of membrane protease activity
MLGISVSNSLFIRCYPAAGAEVVPATFGAGVYGYFILCLLPSAAIVWIGIALRDAGTRPTWLFAGLLISVIAFCCAVGFLRALRLEIRQDDISYRSVLRGTRFIAYPDISAVVLVDFRHLRSEATARHSLRRWTMIITPIVETGGSPLKIPLTLFSDSAHHELVRLLRPEEWESGS